MTMEKRSVPAIEDIVQARGLEADPAKREQFKARVGQKALEHLKANFPDFLQHYQPELRDGNLVTTNGVVGNPPTLLMRDPAAYKKIEDEVRAELGMAADT